MTSKSSHGAANISPRFCTSVVMNKLTEETRNFVAKVLRIQDENILASDDEESPVNENASKEYPQYSQSQSETLKCCTYCPFTPR